MKDHKPEHQPIHPRYGNPLISALAPLSLLFTATALAGEANDYHFNESGVSRAVLENYLERAVTMAFYLVPVKPEGRRVYPYHQDDFHFLRNIGAKFIGRAIYRWGFRFQPRAPPGNGQGKNFHNHSATNNQL